MDKLKSGQIRYPSNHWGAFVEDSQFDVGIVGENWIALARSAWIETGGTIESFEAAFPEHTGTPPAFHSDTDLMRLIGNRPSPLPGPTGPSEADVAASQEIAMAAPRIVPKGIHRYRSHAEADQAMRKWTIDGMVERNLELADKADEPSGPKIR